MFHLNLLSEGADYSMDESLLNYNPTVEYALKNFFNKQRALYILPDISAPGIPLSDLEIITNDYTLPSSWGTTKLRRANQINWQHIRLIHNQITGTSVLADHQLSISLGKAKVGAGFVSYLKPSQLANGYLITEYFVELTKAIKRVYGGSLSIELLVLPGNTSLYNYKQDTVTYLWLKTTSQAIRDHGNDWIKEHWISTDIK